MDYQEERAQFIKSIDKKTDKLEAIIGLPANALKLDMMLMELSTYDSERW